MAFMFELERQSETAGCSSGLVWAAGSRAKTGLGYTAAVEQHCGSQRAAVGESSPICDHHTICTHKVACCPGGAGVRVGVHAAVSGGAATCPLCLQLLWHCFAPQAAEVNTIMELALPALPRGPAGWTHTGSNRVDAGRHSWNRTFL